MGNIDIERGFWSEVKSVDCHAAQNQRLSAEARALLWYLLSKPGGWSMRLEDVMREFGWGDKAWRTVRNNLGELGYLEGKIIQGRGYVWTFRSRPPDDWIEGEFRVEGAVRRGSSDATPAEGQAIKGNQIPDTEIPESGKSGD